MALKKGSTKTPIDVDEFPEVPNEIPRDRWDRPLIQPLDGGKPVAYTRASTLGKAIEDTYHLSKWQQRSVAFGLSRRQDLVALVASIATNEGDDRAPLDELCQKAHEAAKGDKGANVGTALHKLSERRDKGEDLTYLPPILLDAMDAYSAQMKPFTVLASETFVVCDPLQTAGSFDRVVMLLVDLEFRHATKKRVVLPAGTVLVLDLKGLALDTPLPTPTGWTTMGDAQVGDWVIGSDGKPCRVTAKSRTKRIGTYVVTFDDGEQVTCDREHLWWVKTGRSFSTTAHGTDRVREQVIDVETMRDTLFRYGQRQHRVPVAGPLELPAAELPIDPYLFGCWLGDGKMTGGEITKGDDLFQVLEADGHALGTRQVDSRSGIITRTVRGLRTKLRLAGLLGHRTIPDVYLRGSVEQRTALLRGLMDTDGTWNQARDRATFTSTDKALAGQVAELALTLGLKPQCNSWAANGYGVTTTAYGVEFLPIGFNPFRLPRKAERVTWNKNEARARNRIVYSVEPGPDVETACIAVDSPNHTYLCGPGMVPTHNTGKLESAKYWGAAYGVQQTVYACGQPYELGVGRKEWADLLGEGLRPSTDWALILHVPSDSPQDAGLVIVDLEAGAVMADLALDVREARKNKALMSEAYPVPAAAPIDLAACEAHGPHPVTVDCPECLEILNAIATASGEDELTALWVEFQDVWTAEYSAAAKARVAELAEKPLDIQPSPAGPPHPDLKVMAKLKAAQTEAELNGIWEIYQDVWSEDMTRMVKARMREISAVAS